MSIIVKLGSGAIAQLALAAQHAAEAAANKLNATSATSILIPAAGGSVTLTTQAEKSFDIGAKSTWVADDAPTTAWMALTTTAYSDTTLTATVDRAVGVGTTHSAWTGHVSGAAGEQGIEGPTGSGNVERVRFAAINVVLSALVAGSSNDGLTVQSGDVCVLPRQANPAENGIYSIAASGPPTRHPDFATADAHAGLVVSVQGGTSYRGSMWQGVSPVGGVVDVDPILFDLRDGPGLGPFAVTTGLSQYLDSTGQVAVGFDPASGPAFVHGDRPASLPFLAVSLGVGQSLIASGPADSAAIPAVHKAPIRPSRFLMLDQCNLYGLSDTDILTLNLNKIVAAHERITETPLTGFFVQHLDYEDRNRIPSPTRIFINCGRPGAAYPAIKKGTTPFANGLNAVQALVNRYGRGNVYVERILYDHGESNSTDDEATYGAHLSEIYDDYNSDVDGLRFITGQSAVIPFYCACISFVTAPRNSGDGVIDALLTKHIDALASSANRQMFLAGTQYQFFYGNTLHLLPRSNFEWGSLWGQSVAELFYEGSNGVFWPTGATIDGNDIVLATNATSDLAYDNTTIPDRGDAGFVVRDLSDIDQPIDTVAVSGTSIRLTMASTPSAGWVVKYARTDTRTTSFGPGGRGNIRDSRSTVIAYDGTPIRQWMLPRNITVA